jgi:hypothetical protein
MSKQTGERSPNLEQLLEQMGRFRVDDHEEIDAAIAGQVG